MSFRSIATVRKIAIAEGISYLAFAVTMPLKYSLDIMWPNKIVGWAHGLLFIFYWLAMLWAWRKLKWNFGTLVILLLASLIPVAPFWIEKKYLQAESAQA